jgi:hypothetical protein
VLSMPYYRRRESAIWVDGKLWCYLQADVLAVWRRQKVLEKLPVTSCSSDLNRPVDTFQTALSREILCRCKTSLWARTRRSFDVFPMLLIF